MYRGSAEWNFIGVDDKKAQSVVNSISQIALQGSGKYNVGFFVVATAHGQRIQDGPHPVQLS